MHPNLRVSRSRLWGVLLAALLASLPASLFAQQPAPAARPQADREVIVPIGAAESLAHKSGLRIADVSNSNPETARITRGADPTRVIVLGLQAGVTRVVLTDENNAKDNVDIVVQTDVEYLRRMLRLATPTANIGLVPSPNGGVILTGYVAMAQDSIIAVNTARQVFGERVVDALHIAGVQQVQLDVCVARVDRRRLRQMNFTFLEQGQQHFFSSTLGASPTASGSESVALTSASATASGTGNLFLGIVNQKQQFFGFLAALKTEGLGKFMVHPTLVTMSGRPASFLDGGEQAVPVPAGLGQTGVQFEEFGTRLNFLPIVLGNGKIHLEVEPEVSQLSAANGTTIQGTTVPGRVTQRVHTTVELEAGQTYVIGGLIQHTFNAGASKVPVIGDLPFLGAAFRGINDDEEEVEMLIIVTPYLVDAMDCSQLPKYLPGQETRSPDDFELYLEGILEAPRGQREVFPNHCYQPAYRAGPTAGAFPCGGKACGGSGNCASGTCGQSMFSDGGELPAPMPAPAPVPALMPAPMPLTSAPTRPVQIQDQAANRTAPAPAIQPPSGSVPVTQPVKTQEKPNPKVPDVPAAGGKPTDLPAPPAPRVPDVNTPKTSLPPLVSGQASEKVVPASASDAQPFLLLPPAKGGN